MSGHIATTPRPATTLVLPGVHLIAALLKRWLMGTLHHRITDAHLRHYLDEYTFGVNRRTVRKRGLLFYRGPGGQSAEVGRAFVG